MLRINAQGKRISTKVLENGTLERIETDTDIYVVGEKCDDCMIGANWFLEHPIMESSDEEAKTHDCVEEFSYCPICGNKIDAR